MASSSSGRVHVKIAERNVLMDILVVPPPVRDKLGEAGSEGLVTIFADAHRLAVDSFERRLGDEIAKFRLDVAQQLADMRFELLKWIFLFWIGQVGAIAAVMIALVRMR
jgi:hypothetical protein